MVLESLIDPKTATNKPLRIFVISVLFTIISVWLAYNLFPAQSSILSVAFMTIFFVPFFQRLFSIEEKKDELAARRRARESFLKRHSPVVVAYAAFFMGMVVTYSFLYVFNPSIRDVYSLQLDWFRSQGIAAVQPGNFERYLINNTQVMVLFFILSVLFGAGAAFILAWNASVIAVFVGMAANKLAPALGAPIAYVYGIGTGLGSIALHGIPEIGGYFFAGVAGGVLSVGLLRERFMSKEFKEVVKDSLMWLAMGEALIIAGAFLEAVF
ncbi:MAG: stage II sporulation protein M [Candidatus Aenigmatarchaeota archaeon]